MTRTTVIFRARGARALLYSLLFLASSGHGAGGTSIIPAAPQVAADAYLLMDADSGRVLVSHNDGLRLPPASLTKMMTSYVAASELKRGSIRLTDEVEVSVKAWRMGGSRMYIREGTRVSVEDLLWGIIVQSGNDASVALAEHVSGSEDAFVDVMNQQAALLGMSDTQYRNATGWPDEAHYTTARDLAKLTIALIRDFPEHYRIYAERYFTYNDIRQPNRNNLLWRDKSVDGVKTGHTEAAGYCLVASAKRRDMRLISVVMGASDEETRARESQKLLTYGFRYYETHRLYEPDKELTKVRIWGGTDETLSLGLMEAIVVTTPRGMRDQLSATMDIGNLIRAPLVYGEPAGHLSITMDDQEVIRKELVALQAVEQSGLLSRMWDAIVLFFMQLFGMDILHVE